MMLCCILLEESFVPDRGAYVLTCAKNIPVDCMALLMHMHALRCQAFLCNILSFGRLHMVLKRPGTEAASMHSFHDAEYMLTSCSCHEAVTYC